MIPLRERLRSGTAGRRKLDSLLGVAIYAGLEAAAVFVLARAFVPASFGAWILFYTGFFLFDRIHQGFYGSALVRFLSGAATRREEEETVGSAWAVALGATVGLDLLVYLAWFAFRSAGLGAGMDGLRLFALWYPVIALVRVPFLIALSLLQVQGRFDRIIHLRLAGMGLFVLVASIRASVGSGGHRMDLLEAVLIFTAAHLFGSAYAVAAGWSGWRHLRRASRRTAQVLIDYGKYSMGTLLGANLLRDADVFLIGFFMTSQDVALFGVPLKVIDALNVPLAAMVGICFPAMARASGRGAVDEVNRTFYRYTGAATLLFLPLLGLMALLARPLVWVMGGSAYVETGASTQVLRVFLLYGLFLAADRFIGVTLDSVNRPGKNLFKVALMASINVAGDLVAILVFHSLVGVALATVVNVICGVAIGLFFLRKETGIEPARIFTEGMAPFRELARRFVPSRSELPETPRSSP